jgi:hypothetical protein
VLQQVLSQQVGYASQVALLVQEMVTAASLLCMLTTIVCLYNTDCSSTMIPTCCGLLYRGCSKLLFAQWRYGCCFAPSHGVSCKRLEMKGMAVAVLHGMLAGVVWSA